MTVLAWDGRILACDRQTTVGEMKVETQKLVLLPELRTAMACAGDAGRCRGFAHWVANGRNADDFPSWQTDIATAVDVLMVVDGVPYIYNMAPFAIAVLSQFLALGSGSDIAVGAMAMGANAVEAVQITNRISPHCGMGVSWAICR